MQHTFDDGTHEWDERRLSIAKHMRTEGSCLDEVRCGLSARGGEAFFSRLLSDALRLDFGESTNAGGVIDGFELCCMEHCGACTNHTGHGMSLDMRCAW